ncbi:antibiotic resistance protein [Campylobacter upsaliensis]|nr:antibiotic resistance protein [Campylobacter upsaliensis]EAK3777904.1 antibiotic resistance protein [Campylobacter upsaliensis]EKP4839856.1 pyridoxamine 5'-phosphate oxidase family protein [Campylobacter upsaliensis]
MRRDEFKCDDLKLVETMLNSITFGTMIIPDVRPYGVPISFAYENGQIYFHGAKAGRKYELLKHNPLVSFNAVKPYAYIPSSFLNNTMIPTQFFFSVYVEGQFFVEEDFERKKQILKALVKKYENKNIDMEKSPFRGQEKGVFVGIIEVQNISVKAKFGQNLKKEAFFTIMEDLENRGTSLDKETLELMRYFKP